MPHALGVLDHPHLGVGRYLDTPSRSASVGFASSRLPGNAQHDVALVGQNSAMSKEPGLFEVLYTCRAMRRLKPDPVPRELLLKLIDATTQAPSGSNQQRARWIIVQDQTQKAKLAELNRRGVEAYVGPPAS